MVITGGLRPIGGLNKDSELLDVKNGDYLNALNIRKTSNEGNTTNSVENVVGNEQVFDLGTVTVTTATATRDAVDISVAGQLKVIGSYDLLGDVFIFSSSATKEAAVLSITNVTSVAPLVVTVANHGLTTGESVGINSVLGAVGANGSWTVTVIDANTFSLNGSANTGAYISGGNLLKNQQGVGEIGVAVKNTYDEGWVYTRLIRSRQLNFTQLHQMEVRIEVDGVKKSIYFTDNYNPPRVMYYYGEYMTDGFLSAINPDGIYSLATVGAESILLLASPNVVLNVFQDTGGFLKAGNWRYAVRLGFSGGSLSEWSALTNPISVFLSQTVGDDNAQFIYGNQPDVVTTKLNNIRVTNLPLGVYTDIELAAIQYVGEVPTGGIVKSQNIPSNVSEVTLQHTGGETVRELDLTTLNQIFTSIARAQNLVLIDNRLALSNVKLVVDSDLSSWAQTIQYTVKREALRDIGDLSTTPALQIGEYMLPDNIYSKAGYTLNEIYRCGVQVKYKNAGWSKSFYVADVTIDTSGASGQRLGGLPDYSLTDSANNASFSFYIEWTNVNLDFVLPNGLTLRDSIEAIRFTRVQVIPEILATGLLVLDSTVSPLETNPDPFQDPPVLVSGTTNRLQATFVSPDVYIRKSYPDLPITVRVFDNPTVRYSSTYPSGSVAEYTGDLPSITSYLTYTPTAAANSAPFGLDMYNLLFGVPVTKPVNAVPDYGVYMAQIHRNLGGAAKYGATDANVYETTDCQAINISTISVSSTFAMFGGDTFTQKTFKKLTSNTGIPFVGGGFYSQNKVNAVLQLNDFGYFTIPGVLGINGLRIERFLDSILVSYNYNEGYSYRNLIQNSIAFDPDLAEIENQPVRIYWSEIKPVGGLQDNYRVILPLNFTDLEPINGAIEHMEVLNKELFTWQPRSFMRQYFNSRGTLSGSDSSQILIGDGSVLSRGGDELSRYGASKKGAVIVGVSPGGKDTCYWINFEYKKYMRFGYDGTVVVSDIKNMQSWFSNNLSFADLYNTPAYNYGINGVYNNRFQEAIFTIRTVIDQRNINLVSIGDIVMKNQVVKTTEVDFNGFNVFYKAKSGFTVRVESYPKTGLEWETYWNKIEFTDGDYFSYFTAVFDEYRNNFAVYYSFKPKIYIQAKNTFLTQHPTSTEVYEHNRGEECEWYKQELVGAGTISYIVGSATVTGAGTNFFTQFANMDYVNYQLLIDGEEYEIASVESATSLTLVEPSLATGTMINWGYTRSLCEDGEIEMICTEQPNIVKMWNAMRFNTEIKPKRVDFKTDLHESYLEEVDFEEVEQQFDAPIKLDSTKTAENPDGGNDNDTSRLWGKYLKVKLYFEKRKYQKLYDAFIHFVPNSRMFNK